MADREVPWLDDAEMTAWRAFLAAHARLLHVLDQELQADHGLGISDHQVLIYLSESPGGRLRMAELADRLLLSRSGLTRRIDGLVRDGLVQRGTCPEDRRGVMAELTDEGWARLRTVTPSHVRSVRAHFVDVLDREELAALAEVLARVAAGAPDPVEGTCGQASARAATEALGA